MRAHGRPRWAIDQVADQEGAILVVSELYQEDFRDMCLDPDGSGGMLISLADLLKAYGR
jgi:hypothetical protein